MNYNHTKFVQTFSENHLQKNVFLIVLKPESPVVVEESVAFDGRIN